MSTPNKPASVTEGPGAGEGPPTILEIIPGDHPEIRLSQDDSLIFFSWPEFLLLGILQVADMDFNSRFLGEQPPPRDREELAVRVLDYCRNGAGNILENTLVCNLTVNDAVGCMFELGVLSQDPYIKALRAALGQPIARIYHIADREQIRLPPIEL